MRYQAKEGEDPESFDACATHILFPIRYVPFKHDGQLFPEHPGYKSLSEPSENDQNFFRNMAGVVARSGGTMDMSKLEWSIMKERHPSHGRVTVRIHCMILGRVDLKASRFEELYRILGQCRLFLRGKP